MLVIDVSLNRVHYIDEIQIHRCETGENGDNTYRIVRPEGFEDVRIKHRYDSGYLPLLKQVIDIISR